MSLDPNKVVASFDSASVMHAATVAALRHERFSNLGNPQAMGIAARAGSHLPWSILGPVYARIGGAEGIHPDLLDQVDLSDVAESFASAYTASRYPAIFVGSSNGALTHLAAAMGAPWLPGTVLVPVKHVSDPERPDLALDFGARVAPGLLQANPDIVLHQMHDSEQDALMAARMAYFRVKWSRLPAAYVRFLTQNLADGAPVVLVHDESLWPVTRVSDRHVFQAGGRGGLSPDEYLAKPNTPNSDTWSPEAEWGSGPGFSAAVREWCAENGHPIVEIRIDGPQEAAHPVAEILRGWIRERGGEADHLVVPSFVLADPGETLRIGAVPFWTFFAVESAVESLDHHLSHSEPYREIDAFLFQHGAESAGRATPEMITAVCAKYGVDVRFPGLRTEHSPRDIGAMGRYAEYFERQPSDATPWIPLTPSAAADGLSTVIGERGRTLVRP